MWEMCIMRLDEIWNELRTKKGLILSSLSYKIGKRWSCLIQNKRERSKMEGGKLNIRVSVYPIIKESSCLLFINREFLTSNFLTLSNSSIFIGICTAFTIIFQFLLNANLIYRVHLFATIYLYIGGCRINPLKLVKLIYF